MVEVHMAVARPSRPVAFGAALMLALTGCTSTTPQLPTAPPSSSSDASPSVTPTASPSRPLATSATATDALPTAPEAVPTPAATAPRTPQTACGYVGSTIYLLRNATDFDYYDPQRVDSLEDIAFFGATITRSLVAYKYSPDPAEARTLVPDMATDTGRTNSDATSWSFTLRDGLTWQDGSPVKCEDVSYGVSRTFATDVINGGPTYAIAYLDIPANDQGTSQYRGPYSASPEQQALFDAAVVCDGSTITFNLARTVPDF